MWYNNIVMYMKTKKGRKKHKNKFYKWLCILLIIVSATLLGILYYLDVLPNKFIMPITIVILIFDLFNIIFINLPRLKTKVKRFLSVFIILAILLMIAAIFFVSKTWIIGSSNGESKYKTENYSIIVLKDSKYKELKDIENETVGFYEKTVGTKDSTNALLKKVNVKLKEYNDSNLLISDLLSKKIKVILLEDSIINILKEENAEFSNKIRILDTIKVGVEVESTKKDVNVTEKPFAIYISGIDTYGEISSVSRSDVNMVMVINPKTKQVLLISIPRDYYVQLSGTTGTKDKLTHAGIYGIDVSIKTIEALLDVDINYYIKVNFTSVIDIVNALGGLDVYSEYSFISYSGFNFKKGYNSVNGEQALDFARTRKAFADGDRQRGKNQQAVIEAIIRKVTNKTIITKYNSLLDAINGKYQTNMGIKKITSLVKMQLDDMSPWTVTSYSLTGKDAYDYTYTYNNLLYVMKPDEDSILEAKSLIKEVLGDKSLESSYTEKSGQSNVVTKAPSSVQSQPKKEEKQPEEEKDEEDDENNEDIISDDKLGNSADNDDSKKEENNEKEPNITEDNNKSDENLDKDEESDNGDDPIQDLIPEN